MSLLLTEKVKSMTDIPALKFYFAGRILYLTSDCKMKSTE